MPPLLIVLGHDGSKFSIKCNNHSNTKTSKSKYLNKHINTKKPVIYLGAWIKIYADKVQLSVLSPAPACGDFPSL